MEIFKEEDLEEFKSGKLVVNCKTEELAKEFVELCFKNGIGARVEYISDIFNQYKEFTCFRNGVLVIMFDHMAFYEIARLTIKEFKGLKQTETKKTLLEYFMQIHELEEGEEFTISNDGKYRILGSIIEELNKNNEWKCSFVPFANLNMLEIAKASWKPSRNEECYYINLYSNKPILTFYWGGSSVDEKMFERGLIHRTKEDAEKRLEEIIELNKQ